jgi:hypothetical protein
VSSAICANEALKSEEGLHRGYDARAASRQQRKGETISAEEEANAAAGGGGGDRRGGGSLPRGMPIRVHDDDDNDDACGDGGTEASDTLKSATTALGSLAHLMWEDLSEKSSITSNSGGSDDNNDDNEKLDK